MSFDVEPYWTLIVQEYDRRQRRKVRNIAQPTTIAAPNRRLSDWEDTPKGRHLVLRNVDRTLMRLSETSVNRLLKPIKEGRQS
jgi:hypothetical protein